MNGCHGFIFLSYIFLSAIFLSAIFLSAIFLSAVFLLRHNNVSINIHRYFPIRDGKSFWRARHTPRSGVAAC